jgi:hypothetical protein
VREASSATGITRGQAGHDASLPHHRIRRTEDARTTTMAVRSASPSQYVECCRAGRASIRQARKHPRERWWRELQ